MALKARSIEVRQVVERRPDHLRVMLARRDAADEVVGRQRRVALEQAGAVAGELEVDLDAIQPALLPPTTND